MTFTPLTKYTFALQFSFVIMVAFAQSDMKHPVEDVRHDFKILREALEQAHAGIYWYRTKTEMDSVFDAAYSSLNGEMTELQFYRTIAPIISKIGCGHTWIATTEPTQEKIWDIGKILPLKLKFINGRAYCIQNNSSDSTTIGPGDEILSINNYTVDSLLKLSNTFSPGDGFIEVGKWRILDNVFNQFFSLYTDQPGTYRIKAADKQGIVKETTIEGISLKQIETVSKRRFVNVKKNPPTVENIHLSFLEKNNVALLTIKEFADWNKSGKRIKFKNEVRRIFHLIASSKAQNLIIDVRDNDGGDQQYALDLLTYLTDKSFIGYKQIDFRTTDFSFIKYTTTTWLQYKFLKILLNHDKLNDTTFLLTNSHDTRLNNPRPNHVNGNIFVLINRGTFSAASDFAALLHSNNLATFIGEETGGSYHGNTSNYTFLLTLPNTKIKVNIPVARYQTNVLPPKLFGRGIIPHYEIQYDIEEVLQGIDKEMNTAVRLSKN